VTALQVEVHAELAGARRKKKRKEKGKKKKEGMTDNNY
jgi:hypothetical protein